MYLFILTFYFNIIFGQIGIPTFQGTFKSSSSLYPMLSQCSGDNIPTNTPFNYYFCVKL